MVIQYHLNEILGKEDLTPVTKSFEIRTPAVARQRMYLEEEQRATEAWQCRSGTGMQPVKPKYERERTHAHHPYT
jgi:hypothetical protein